MTRSSTQSFQRIVLVGLPRCGTTLVATLLGSQPGIHFLTDYFPAFSDALSRLGKRWNEPLNASQRRIALALVRDQFLRVRHPVLIPADAFTTLDDLHRLVMDELRQPGDRWLGHKLLLGPALLRATLADSPIHCLLMIRDPRDAALSYFHRTGAGVERYLRNWRETVRLSRELSGHPRFLAVRFEDLLGSPAPTLERLGSWLGTRIDPGVPALAFQRSRAHGTTQWSENSAFGDVRARFDQKPLGRWRERSDSTLVRYAGWVARHELAELGYDPCPKKFSAREHLEFAGLATLERLEHRAYESLGKSARWARRHLAEVKP